MSKRWKSVTDRLALHKVTTDLQFVKQTKTRPEHVKHNKMKSNKMNGACTVIINLSSFSSYKLLLLFSHYVQQFCDRIDCSPPGSSVHGILQARILEGLPFPPPGDLLNPGIEPSSPALQEDSSPLSHQGSRHINYKQVYLFSTTLSHNSFDPLSSDIFSTVLNRTKKILIKQ